MRDEIFEIEIDKITDTANFVKNSLSDSPIIIIGERHHNRTDRWLQETVMEFIKDFEPRFFLCELLHAASYDPNHEELTFRDDDTERNDPVKNTDEFRTFEEGFYYNIGRNYNVKIIGCDLPSCIKRDLDRCMYNQIREKKMGEIITDYSKSSEPLIVVLGNNHVKESYIYNFIKSGYISICIDDKCYNCNKNIDDQHQQSDLCKNCNSIRTRKIKTISFK